MRFCRAFCRAFCHCAMLLLAGWGSMGCRATPGFAWSMAVTQPPVLLTPAPVTPIAAPATAYAVEDVQAFPRYVRQPIIVPRQAMEACPPGCPPGCVPAPAPATAPQLQQAPALPMPRGPAKVQPDSE